VFVFYHKGRGVTIHKKVVIAQKRTFKFLKILEIYRFTKNILFKSLFNTKNSQIFFIIGIGTLKGNMKIREKIYKEAQVLLKPANIINPKSHVSKFAKIGSGNLIEAFAKISAGAKIGNNCVHFEDSCRHFYFRKDSLKTQSCLVCKKLKETRPNLLETAERLIEEYNKYFLNETKLSYNSFDIENIYYKWIYKN
jgi:carbonic anhydrase/acetyltransferase-like protein (isoleucine patch superfamily)